MISNSAGGSHERADYVPIRGAHIYAVRGPYSHHGVDRGDGTVVHFRADDGRKISSAIRIVTLAEFSQGDPIKRREYGRCVPPEMVVARAESMVGRSGYDLFANNCEHFATWCVVVTTRAGGTALGGVTLVAGVGAAVGTGTVMVALRDKPYH